METTLGTDLTPFNKATPPEKPFQKERQTSEDVNTGRVWSSNDQFQFGLSMVQYSNVCGKMAVKRFECQLNVKMPLNDLLDHLNNKLKSIM